MHAMGISNARIFFLFYSSKMLFWLFLLLEIIAVAKVYSQPSTQGFISIDCGGSTNYTDATTGIPYVTDDPFTDDGVNSQVASSYRSSSSQGEQTLRSFPNATRSCYALKPVIKNRKYLLRGTFYYGNYDGQNSANTVRPLQFDLYFDANFWRTVNITDPSYAFWYEVLAVAMADSVSVCLVNTGSGTPFISVLEFRPIPDVMYPAVNTTQFLITNMRCNVGPPLNSVSVRYPQDPYDRLWEAWTANGFTEITTDESIDSSTNSHFQPPSIVMQSAATPSDNSSIMEIWWYHSSLGISGNDEYVNLFFSEFTPNTTRTFNIYLNDYLGYSNYTPPYLIPDYIYNTGPNTPSQQYRWALNSSGLSSLPPILNAMEVFTAMQFDPIETSTNDVDAINDIKELYRVKRSWIGDPCVPQQYPWDGVNCSYETNPARIISINLSSSGLSGSISSSFHMFAAIKYLDLSYNNLTGPIPDALGVLSSLQILNLTGNNLTGTIPSSLLQKQNLVFSHGGNPNLCPGGTSCGEEKKKHSSAAIIVIICIVSVVLLIVAIIIVWTVIKKRGSSRTTYPEQNIVQPIKENNVQESPLPIENRVFTYKELEIVTNNFKRQLGKGGFGPVFHGYLQNNVQVAVKMLSQSSSQGMKEFRAEIQNLTRIHHKNLVSLLGYCMEGDILALVYEYMPQGTLQDHLTGKFHSEATYSWARRLNIAIGAAQGLEYLHTACNPPLIHRDVKSSNILLSESLEAKVADFGLSKSFNMDNRTQMPNASAVVGTPGYIDPEYSSSNQISEKSDVYSFGVIILELITGQPPVVRAMNSNAISLVQWVRQRLAKEDIENIVDRNLRMGHDINSIWKAVDLALRCTELDHRQRPTMAHVVKELNESLELECAYSGDFSTGRSQTNTISTTFEVEPPPFFAPGAR
ncbi:probable LRR receptor-like serine/threonine-protein kinase At1g05700 [Zingiber officinale]|nr:probable LRR receptor-like serine/threonine-protein kinase At1g05700 [Zingiber officinale]